MKKTNRNFWERNRFLSHRSKKTKGWCDGCDKEIVELGKKCLKCGKKYKTKRSKK